MMDGMATETQQPSMETPPANPRYLDSRTPEQIQSRREGRDEALRRLATRVEYAVDTGATWEEIRDTVEQAAIRAASIDNGKTAVLSACMRYRVNNGDDSFWPTKD